MRARAEPWLLLVLVIALGLRLWGIDFGLPDEHARPDERHVIGFSLTAAAHRLNPGFFNYPSLYLYVLVSAYALYFAFGLVTGHFHSPQDLVAVFSLAPKPLYLIDRCVVALLGTATVGVVYWIGARATGRRAGLLAALFLSVAYLHVRESHFGTVDVPMTFFATLAVAIVLHADAARTVASYAWVGFVAGLATSTKYNAVALMVPIGLLHLLTPRAQDRAGSLLAFAKHLSISVAALVVGFLVGTPYALLDHHQFVQDALSEIVSKSTSMPALADPGVGWIHHARITLPVGLGLPMLLAALAGVVVAFKERPRVAALLFAFPAAWYLGIGKSHWGLMRYAVPLIPMLCVFAGWFVDGCVRAITARVGQPLERRASMAAVAALSAVVMFPSLQRSIQWDSLMERTDSRVVVREWVERHIPSGARIGVVGNSYIRPEFWSDVTQLERSLSPTGTANGIVQGRRIRNQVRLAHIRNTPNLASYDVYFYEDNSWNDILRADLRALVPPEYVIVADHPAWTPKPGDLPTLGPEYVLAASFQAFHDDADAVFDHLDALYVPYDSFGAVERPGPNVRVFHRGESGLLRSSMMIAN